MEALFPAPNRSRSQLRYQGYTRLLLIVTGAGLMLALVAVFMPVTLMASAHQWLGLGPFPDAPITRYLARSTSLLYFMHGCVLAYVGWKFSQLHSLVPLLGFLHIVLGATMLGVDWFASMPAYWTAGEGIPVALMGLLMLWLYRRCGLKGSVQK